MVIGAGGRIDPLKIGCDTEPRENSKIIEHLHTLFII